MKEDTKHSEKKEVGEKLKIKSGVKVLLTWKAQERMWHPKDRQWYLISALAILIPIFVAVRLNAWIMLLALMLFALLWFVQGYLQPWEVEHKVTTKGIFTHNTLYAWDQIRHFWFGRKDGQLLLHIDFPREMARPRMTLLLPDSVEMNLFNELIDYIKYATPQDAEDNLISRLIYGEYVAVSNFIEDIDQPE